MEYKQVALFSSEECDRILNIKRTVQDRSSLAPPFTENWINGIPRVGCPDVVVEPEPWLVDRIKTLFKFQDYATVDGLWPLIYKEYWEGNKLGYHTDDVKGIKRVGISIQLNDDYEGGDLQLLSWRGNLYDNQVTDVTVPRGIGLVTIFPIFIPHRVTPITSGIRKQLVTWMTGKYLNW